MPATPRCSSVARLVNGIPTACVSGSPGTVVRGIAHDSRCVQRGDVFVCIRGASTDGHSFADQAISRGASALVVSADHRDRMKSLVARAVVVAVPDPRAALPIMAAALYGNPSQHMVTVGVTGTNGKTTTTRMIAAILGEAGHKVGAIGTLGAELGGESLATARTTPEADDLQRLLAGMRDRAASAVVMEVSSHALAQHRADAIAFSAGVFTNLTQDHLDYHSSMDRYFEAKARLFTEYPVRYPRTDGSIFVAAINVDAWPGRDLVSRARGDVVTFAVSGGPAVLSPRHVEAGPQSVRFEACFDSGSENFILPVSLPVGGEFQVSNALGAIAVALRLGVDRDRIVAGLAGMIPVPGRFEPVPTGNRGFSVIVDYAHTPDGLENLLRSARALKPRRVLLVFGCGGDRDRAKRPLMARIAADNADLVIITSDNPRHEDPLAIIAEARAGLDGGAPGRAAVEIEPDRRLAISAAIAHARARDIVLIAGKGHEQYQIVGDTALPFDDRAVAREALG